MSWIDVDFILTLRLMSAILCAVCLLSLFSMLFWAAFYTEEQLKRYEEIKNNEEK